MSYTQQIIDGKCLANEILQDIIISIEKISLQKQRIPTLAVILVGNNPASAIYVKHKQAACAKVGIHSVLINLSADISQHSLLEQIQTLNNNTEIDAILVQLPLPPHINNTLVIDNIAPDKDVDGFHRFNVGALSIGSSNIVPCTPSGMMYILDRLACKYHGSHAVILGSSNIVGKPIALELINRGATVTVCNSKTIALPQVVALADILIAAIGKPNFVQASWLKLGCTVLDVGINRLANGQICGDVDFNAALVVATHITPVPGGIGPMTIAMLLQNTLKCYTSRLQIQNIIAKHD